MGKECLVSSAELFLGRNLSIYLIELLNGNASQASLGTTQSYKYDLLLVALIGSRINNLPTSVISGVTPDISVVITLAILNQEIGNREPDACKHPRQRAAVISETRTN